MDKGTFIVVYIFCLILIYGNYSSRNSPLKQYASENSGAFAIIVIVGPGIVASIVASIASLLAG